MDKRIALGVFSIALLIVGPLGYVIVQPKDSEFVHIKEEEYWVQRAKLITDEEVTMIGGDIIFQPAERAANDILMQAKHAEVDNAFDDPAKFLPSENFLLASEKIRQSPVFKIIQSMPKGSVLHAHDTAIVSADFVFSNITHRPNLYGCEINGDLVLRFFDEPTSDCNWQLLRDIRQKDRTIDERIKKKLTMRTAQPALAYPTVDAAWNKFMSIFMFIDPFITYRPVYEDYFYQGLLEFYNDNILYLELRTTLPTLYDLDGTTYDKVQVAKIYKNVTDRFIEDHPDFVGVKLIYAPVRKCTDKTAEEYIETARRLKQDLPDFIAGFDLVGQEDKGEPLSQFVKRLRLLGDDIQVFFHAGETNWYGTTTDENLIDAVLLNTKRIGHGYALLKHPRVMELVKEKGIAIEVSPISNQVLSLVKDLRNHPASILFANDYPVVVSNDDPGFFGSKGLSYDFYEAFVGMMSRHADLRALKKLALNSIDYSSMSDAQKKKAMNVWNLRWKKFINKLNGYSTRI